MNKDDNEINLNQMINNSKQNPNEELFSDNSTNIFTKNQLETINNEINDKNVNIHNENNNHEKDNQTTNNNLNQDININQKIDITIETSSQNDMSLINNLEINENLNKEQFEGNKKNIFNILNNKKVILTLTILTFVFTSITVVKTFYLRSKVNDYENFYVEIEEKLSEETIVYNDEENVDDNLKDTAASELISCINSSIDVNNLPTSITSVIDEINNYYNQSNNHFAFKYKDIYTGFTISYNENQKIFTASTIKAPKDIYIYEMASIGKIDLDEKLTYTSKYYNTGAWRLKSKGFNTSYDIRTLVNYSTVASDNAAHNMLMDKFGRTNMLEFWKELGTEAIFTVNNNWGVTNAHDASIYMEELYRFYIENEEYGKELMDNFLNASPKFIKGVNDYQVANKSGWAGTAIHDVSIVFADNPYIVVALSNLGNTDYYMSYFNKANDLAYKLHTEYWKYKMDICQNINQY